MSCFREGNTRLLKTASQPKRYSRADWAHPVFGIGPLSRFDVSVSRLSAGKGYNSESWRLNSRTRVQSRPSRLLPPTFPIAIVDSLLKQFSQSSQLGANAAFVEDLYEQYLVSPDSVDPK
mgnify:CR=1 FL=1